jgi:aspartate/methionine/tyrosine aminotransferase
MPATGLAALADVAERPRRPGWCPDEIYHGLSYEGPDHTVLEFTDRAFVFNGFSKAYAMTGWRLGYLIAPEVVHPHAPAAPPELLHLLERVRAVGGRGGTPEAAGDVRRFSRHLRRARRAMVDGLRALGLSVRAEPTGAFYVFADARRFCERSYDFAFEILAGAHIGRHSRHRLRGRGARATSGSRTRTGLPRIHEALRRLASSCAIVMAGAEARGRGVPASPWDVRLARRSSGRSGTRR